MQELIYEIPTWRDPPSYMTAVTVSRVLAELAKLPTGIPEALEDEQSVMAFADACSIPLCSADIEADLPFPQWRFASRPWVREQYAKFMTWCEEQGWLEAAASPTPPPLAQSVKRGRGRPRKVPLEPAAV